MADPAQAVSQQGHYAGAVTRLAAFVLDQAILTAVFALLIAATQWALQQFLDVRWTESDPGIVTSLLFAFWWFFYYGYPWSISGKTPGMAALGIRVVRDDGAPATARNGVLRALALPLTFLTLGIGFLPIVFAKRRRALHDKLAGTAVVYSWDARGARLRFLARQQEVERPAA